MRGIELLVGGIVLVGILAMTAAAAAVTGFGGVELGVIALVLFGWVLIGWLLGGILERHANARERDGRAWRLAWLVAWVVFPVTGPILLLIAYLVLAGTRAPGEAAA